MEILNLRKTTNGYLINGYMETVVGDENYQDALDWDNSGKEVMVALTDAELLEQAKASKLQQIKDDYSIADAIPVLHNTVTYKGGESSAKGIRDYLEGNRLEGITIHHIWDINGTEKPYTDSEANAVLIAVNAPVRDNSFNKKNRKVALAVATTITEVEAI